MYIKHSKTSTELEAIILLEKNNTYKRNLSEDIMNKWTELLVGLILVILPIVLATLTWTSWWTAALVFLKGALFWGIVGIGLLFILLAIADLKESK